MPTERLDTLNAGFSKLRPDWPRPVLHYGYQMTNDGGFAFAPYLLIRVTDLGHPLDEQSIRAEFKDKSLFPSSGAELIGPVFDTNLNAFIATIAFKIENSLSGKGFTATFQTRTGALKVICAADEASIEKNPDFFTQILRGIQISASEKPVESKPSLHGLLLAITAIVVIVAVLLKAKPVSH